MRLSKDNICGVVIFIAICLVVHFLISQFPKKKVFAPIEIVTPIQPLKLT